MGSSTQHAFFAGTVFGAGVMAAWMLLGHGTPRRAADTRPPIYVPNAALVTADELPEQVINGTRFAGQATVSVECDTPYGYKDSYSMVMLSGRRHIIRAEPGATCRVMSGAATLVMTGGR